MLQVWTQLCVLIAGLSYDTNETVLKDAFGLHGEIIEGRVKFIKVVNISVEGHFLK